MKTMQTLKFVKKVAPPWSIGSVATPGGAVYKVSSGWSRSDYWGMIRSRVSAFRMNYSVTPGLYAIGDPDKGSDVFVTANYKLSFDILRRELKGMNAWMLVLDTKSINVWCAAGKGTFGTDELNKRIAEAKLDTVVTHRRIILPQLGAVGVSASAVQKKTGFRVHFGPVGAKEIPEYVRAGYKKTSEMTTIRFTMLDRLVLTPMEINPALKKFFKYAWIALLVLGMQPWGIMFDKVLADGLPFLLFGLVAVFAGAFLTPVLLPFIPFRSFAIKGWIVGVLTVLLATMAVDFFATRNPLLLATTFLLFPALSSYIALQFTGATTFTGMSGVKKELKIGIPAYIASAVVSAALLVVYKIREWGWA